MKLLFGILKGILKAFYALVFPVALQGAENIPAEGGFILCSNHIHARDPLLMCANLKRRICFMAKKELFRVRLFAAVLKAGGAFPVDRGHADLGAIRESIRVLDRGEGLGIFPQGTRSKENERTKLHSGAAMIAQRTGAPIVPVFIDGPYHPFRRTRIRIGHPIEPRERFGKKCDSETIERVTGMIDDSIWSLKNV